MTTIKPIKQKKFTLDDRYKEFLARNVEPKDAISNSMNLFDDSNQKDTMWLKIARSYLGRRIQLMGRNH